MKLGEILKERGISRYRLAVDTKIAQSDIYCGISGKKPLYPAWRKRIADYLGVSEAEIFPEYENTQS